MLQTGKINRTLILINKIIKNTINPLIKKIQFNTLYFNKKLIPTSLTLKLNNNTLAHQPDSLHPITILIQTTTLTELKKNNKTHQNLKNTLHHKNTNLITLSVHSTTKPQKTSTQNLQLFTNKTLIKKQIDLTL